MGVSAGPAGDRRGRRAMVWRVRGRAIATGVYRWQGQQHEDHEDEEGGHGH